MLGNNVPSLVCGDEAHITVAENLAHLVVCLGDDLVNLLAVLCTDSIEVIEGGVNVAFGTGDESSVALRSISQPLQRLVGLWCLLLDLLCS